MRKYKIRFYENRKKYFAVSIAIMLIGLIFNIIFGTKLDMQFTGGTILKYSYSGENITENAISTIVSDITGKSVSVTMSESLIEDGKNSVSITFTGTEALPLEQQKAITSAFNEKYPDGNFSIIETSSIDANMGKDFFLKCLLCILIAIILLVLYIAFRFKKIGGMAAGVMAVVALIHDVILVYFTFVIFQMPLNDNFIAVVLTILGYSLNDTIVIYDRIRENKKIFGTKVEFSKLVNTSINQTFSRSIHTSVSTFIAIAIVLIVGIVYGLNTIITFALPMMIGVVAGCYSSICIAGPLYVMWKNYKDKKNPGKKSLKKKATN